MLEQWGCFMRTRDDISVTQRTHGGAIESELTIPGLAAAEILDFSVNVNPYGPHPAVVAAARGANLLSYPDSSSTQVRAAIAAEHRLDSAHVVVGNGAADLLWSLARVLLRESVSTVVVEPTFSEFRAAALSTGADVFEWRANAVTNFAMDLQAIGNRVRETKARVVYLASPNTPTGAALPAAEIAEFALEHPAVTLILDQSFLMLSERAADCLLDMPENVIRVRSLTKEHAIPGLRIGYLLTTSSLAQRIEYFRPAWSTNAMAQAAALAAIKEQGFVAASWTKMRTDCQFLADSMKKMGLNPCPTRTAFFVVNVDDGAEIRTRLLRHGILVRDCASFGLHEFIRVSARPEADCRLLVDALEKEMR